MGYVICVNNNKGGSLKTTTTTNLAGVLAQQKKKVLLIDADNQSNVSLSFGENPDTYRTSLYDVLVSNLPPEDAIVNVHKYIDILPSNDELVSFDFEVIGNPDQFIDPFFLMRDTCSHLREAYDYILIDTPPSLSLMVGNAFAFADSVLIPYAPEFYSMRSLIKVVNTIKEFKKEFNPTLEVLGVLRTLVNMNTNLHTDIIQETNKYAAENSLFVFETVIPRTVQFANSVAYDKLPATLLKQNKRDKAQLFFDVWNEIETKLRKGVH